MKNKKDVLENLFDKFSNEKIALKNVRGGRPGGEGCSTDCQPTSPTTTSGGTTQTDPDTIGDDDLPALF